MSLQPQPSPNEIAGRGKKSIFTGLKSRQTGPKAQETWQKLQEALRHGLTVSNTLWSFRMTDWVVSILAAELDNDGEIEILIGTRDGMLSVFTRFGVLKWQRRLGHGYINALATLSSRTKAQEEQPRIIVGLRNGRVIALDKEGAQIKGWEYDTGRIIRQIIISERHPENIIIASEDRHIHVLDSMTGRLRWKYHTQGWVRCVLACDIDGDGEEEFLCGSGDKHLYIFDIHGKLLHAFDTGHQVYALAASPSETPGPVRIIMSSNRKDLAAWEITCPDGKHWKQERLWLSSTTSQERLVENRGHAICMQDIDDDGLPEILVGSEDGYLIVVDYHGQPLWKQNFHSCIYRISVADINRDGQAEILVGTENYFAHVLQLDLVKGLNRRIKGFYAQLTQLYQWNWNQVAEKLTMRESTLLKDFVEEPSSRPVRMELEEGRDLMQEGEYKASLAILLRLLQENIQYCWSQPFTTQGYLWTACLSGLSAARPGRNLTIGTDQGYIYGLDTHQETAQVIWERAFNEQAPYRVRMLCSGPELPGHRSSTVAVLSNYRILLLDDQGQVVQDHNLQKDTGDWARCAYYYPGGENEAGAIIIGMENNKISLWDETLRKQIGQIMMPQGVGAIYAYDILGTGEAQIISGTLKNRVYAHTWEGKELWHFETKDRVQALHVADIDKDGLAEIIVGAEDRNVYVLDVEGHLKWRYRTMRGVMDIDVCDIKMERDSSNPDERTLKVLVSSADNYLYMFNACGDLIWKYQTSNRARVVRAGDMNNDGQFEIAIASEDQLELLQIVDRDELVRLSDICWAKLTADYTDLAAIRRLAEEPDEYIRGQALARLAGMPDHNEEDFRLLLKAQREDKSPQVKRDLIRAVVNLHRLRKYQEARQLLERLYQDPEEEIRHQILKILPLLGEHFSFEYLERSLDYQDLWVRQVVVKRLDQLVEAYPQQTFRLLLRTARSEEEWVRQETGNALAHYFEAHVEQLVPDLLTLLEQGTDLIVLQQLSHAIQHPALKGFFLNLLRQLLALHPEKLAEILDEAIYWIGAINELGLFHGEDLLQVYEEFRQLLSARTISAIAGYQRITRSDILNEAPGSLAKQIVPAFDALEETARIVDTYEHRQTIGERVSSLIEARQMLERVSGNLQQHILTRARQPQQTITTFPESHILLLLVQQWSEIIGAELAGMKGSANLTCALGETVVPDEEKVVVVLRVKNSGQCAADNVRVQLLEGADFEILEGKEHTLAEISTQVPALVHFTLHLRAFSARLIFHLTYNDAERRNKMQEFSDKVTVQQYQRAYHSIHNPYTTGTPIRNTEMFYGRKEDLDFLRKSLGSVSANRVVLLWGQRRMGKTSLIYQLANELGAGAYTPVFIDLQELALKETVSQLLESFAQHIAKEIECYKHIQIVGPVHEQFLADPTDAFRNYLSTLQEYLPDHRLILLIDEFDGISRYIQRDGEHILYYLRNLMQHYPGLNVLLAGAPHMPYMEGYQSVLFNIAQELRLGKLKPEEARQLIIDPVRDDLEYDSLAVERMLELTDGWPYFIHVMSEKLIYHCNAAQKSYATISDVNAALDLVLDEQESSILWIWQDLSSPIEKLVLALLAQEKRWVGGISSLNDIRQGFDTYGIPYAHSKIIEALNKLKRGDVIVEQSDGNQYSIPVGLIKAWLRKEKPPERVVREEFFFDESLEV